MAKQSFFKKLLDFVSYHQQASNDHLEAYPERLHVAALPERRYLKTSRVLVMAILVSLLFNIAMIFVFVRNAKQINTIVHFDNSQDTFLYNLDYYNKELRPIEKNYRQLNVGDLVYQNLITDYLKERYQMNSNYSEMIAKWGPSGKVAAYAPKLYEAFTEEAKRTLSGLSQGLTQEIYIYSIRSTNNGNFYEAIYDVFTLNESGYGAERCPCKESTTECLMCMRKTATQVRRFKAYMRVALLVSPDEEMSTEQIQSNINPFYFRVSNLYILPQAIHMDNRWEDVDLIIP